MNRFTLEVIAERKITEHLEKGMMPRGITDVFKIVMLAACAHTTLDAHRSRIRTGIAAGEHVFELHHAGIRKQQRWIVAWIKGEERTTVWPFDAKKSKNRARISAACMSSLEYKKRLTSLLVNPRTLFQPHNALAARRCSPESLSLEAARAYLCPFAGCRRAGVGP